ncbi:4837_t:CDS:2 [Funneliformis geosporum]|uniref:4837_t:CDS:1 n=1 Tax=Funneliformis geosporum TaxID=1117311 RepID=A0A9W4X6G4_9GLOM|nr:4837_t:CDS:2 [Funneliformis geosporum]
MRKRKNDILNGAQDSTLRGVQPLNRRMTLASRWEQRYPFLVVEIGNTKSVKRYELAAEYFLHISRFNSSLHKTIFNMLQRSGHWSFIWDDIPCDGANIK